MVSSGTTGAVAAESEGLMQDYKAGYMIGSTPRILTYMQLLAVPIGALALALMYPLLRDTYGIVGEHAQLTSPTSQRWVGFAKIVTHQMGGTGTPGAPGLTVAWMKCSFAVGAAIGVVLTLLEQIKRLKPFVPSPTGIGHGDAHPVQRGDDDVRGGDGRLDLGARASRVAPALLDAAGVGRHRRRSAGRGELGEFPVIAEDVADECLVVRDLKLVHRRHSRRSDPS